MAYDEVFKALADPNRRKILHILRDGPKTAGELANAFPHSKATMSHHFQSLKAAGLVRAEREGQQIFYTLNLSLLEEVTAMFFEMVSISPTEKL